MANTYTQIHIQLIFAVRFRQALIASQWHDDLHQYMTGIIQNNDHKLLQINSVSDHIHILMGLRPVQSLSGFVQNLKLNRPSGSIQKGFATVGLPGRTATQHFHIPEASYQ